MGKKGGKKHLKRKPAPKLWPIHRKESVWTTKPKPGPHPTSLCITLALLVRDILGLARTQKEVKTIVSTGKVNVDGKPRYDGLFPIGLMDVVSIPDVKKDYRVLPSEKGSILHPIEEEEAKFKLCRIENKTITKGGHIQLNLHDGTNMIIPVKDPKKPEEDVYETLDVLKISTPEREILDHMSLNVGVAAVVIGGKNVGKCGKITDIKEKPSQKHRKLLTTIQDKNGKSFQTILDFVFVVGDAESYISLPEVGQVV